MTLPKLRSSEWILLAFFAYIALLIPFFRDRPYLRFQPLIALLAVGVFLWGLAAAENKFSHTVSMIRDWAPMVLTLAAFREMELFVPTLYNTHFENGWARWDRVVLYDWGLKRLIESLGPVIPTYLESCYLLVYGLGTFCLVVIWIETKRRGVNRFYLVLLAGTLLSYALFPYFPTRPPRIAVPDLGMPLGHDVFRRFNLFLLRKATIHSGVFPSAHVSSAFAAAWAMFLVLPAKKRYGWVLLAYALSVTVATVYGRYHYAADALAGFGVSLVAGAIAFFLAARKDSAHNGSSARAGTHLVT